MINDYLLQYKELTKKLIHNDFDNEEEFNTLVNQRDDVLHLIEKCEDKNSSKQLVDEILELDKQLVDNIKVKMENIKVKIDKINTQRVNQGKNKNAINKYSSRTEYQESIYFDKKSE